MSLSTTTPYAPLPTLPPAVASPLPAGMEEMYNKVDLDTWKKMYPNVTMGVCNPGFFPFDHPGDAKAPDTKYEEERKLMLSVQPPALLPSFAGPDVKAVSVMIGICPQRCLCSAVLVLW